MSARKNIQVEQVLKFGNAQLARTDSYTDYKMRMGVIHMLEDVLFASEQYAGFRYLTVDEVGDHMPGIRGTHEDSHEVRFAVTDDSRRYYFMKKV